MRDNFSFSSFFFVSSFLSFKVTKFVINSLSLFFHFFFSFVIKFYFKSKFNFDMYLFTHLLMKRLDRLFKSIINLFGLFIKSKSYFFSVFTFVSHSLSTFVVVAHLGNWSVMKNKTSWNIKVSSYAINSINPIRDIMENINATPNPNKTLIPLSIGT